MWTDQPTFATWYTCIPFDVFFSNSCISIRNKKKNVRFVHFYFSLLHRNINLEINPVNRVWHSTWIYFHSCRIHFYSFTAFSLLNKLYCFDANDPDRLTCQTWTKLSSSMQTMLTKLHRKKMYELILLIFGMFHLVYFILFFCLALVDYSPGEWVGWGNIFSLSLRPVG